MGVKDLVNRLTKPVEEADREKLVDFCSKLEGVQPCDQLKARTVARVVGEVSSVRIVPRAGAASLEVGVSDGRGMVTAVFFGRKKIAGLNPGRRFVIEGMVAPLNNRAFMYNPVYELLPI
jgi:RecG-like helicase